METVEEKKKWSKAFDGTLDLRNKLRDQCSKRKTSYKLADTKIELQKWINMVHLVRQFGFDGPCLIDVVLDPDGYLEQMRSLRG